MRTVQCVSEYQKTTQYSAFRLFRSSVHLAETDSDLIHCKCGLAKGGSPSARWSWLILVASLTQAVFLFSVAQSVYAQTENPSSVADGYKSEELDLNPTNADPSTAVDGDKIKFRQFDKWLYRCVEQKSDDKVKKDICEILQVSQAKYKEKNVNVLTIALGHHDGASGYNRLSILLPLNILLSKGFHIATDNSRHKFKFSFHSCSRAGCWLIENVENDFIKAFKQGNHATARFTLVNGQLVQVKFSLIGFTAAYKALTTGLNIE